MTYVLLVFALAACAVLALQLHSARRRPVEIVPRTTSAPGPAPGWPADGPGAAREAQIEVLQALIDQTYEMPGPKIRLLALNTQKRLLAGRDAYRQNEILV